MKKLIYIFMLIFFVSCYGNKTTAEQLMLVKQGMHYNEARKILKTDLDIYDIESKYFKVRVRYKIDWDTSRYGYINYTRKDSLVVNMH